MNKWLKFLIAIIISAFGFNYAFKEASFSELSIYLYELNIFWLLLSIIFIIFAVFIRASRLKFLLYPFQIIRTYSLFKATMIGHFGNIALPFKLGELLRAYAISSRRSISTSAVMGTIIFERILDLLGLVIIALTLSFFHSSFFFDSSILIFAGLGVGFFSIFIFKIIKNKYANLESIPAFYDNSFGIKLFNIVSHLIEGITSISRSKKVIEILFQTFLIWSLYYLVTYFIILSFNMEIGWVAAGILLIFTTFTMSIPSAPAAIGTYHATVVYVLTNFYMIEKIEAQAFAVIMHVISLLPYVLFV